MADYTVNIATPIITTGKYFRVRYRELPNGVFSLYTNYSSNSFTLTGLTGGTQYEVEISYYNGTELCDPVLINFTARDIEPCWNFSAEILTNGQIFWIRVSWVGTTLPPCGYKFIWTQGTATGTTVYTGGGVPLDLIIPVGAGARLTIIADDCTSERICFDEDIPYDTPCMPIVITDATIEQSQNGYWKISIFYNQSTPRTTPSTFTWVQTNAPTGTTPATGTMTVPISTSPTVIFTFKVFVTAYQGVKPTFDGTMTDICGKVHVWDV